MMNDGKCAGGVEIGVGPCPKCGATDDEICGATQTEHLRHSSPERESLWLMLETYWGKGDGATPPAFIQQAARLCGYQL